MVLIYLFENVRHLSNEICQFQCIFFLIILYRYVIQSISSKRPTCIQSQVPKLAFEAVLCKLALTMRAKRPSLETFLEQNSKDVVAELQVLGHYVCWILETNFVLGIMQRPSGHCITCNPACAVLKQLL